MYRTFQTFAFVWKGGANLRPTNKFAAETHKLRLPPKTSTITIIQQSRYIRNAQMLIQSFLLHHLSLSCRLNTGCLTPYDKNFNEMPDTSGKNNVILVFPKTIK